MTTPFLPEFMWSTEILADNARRPDVAMSEQLTCGGDQPPALRYAKKLNNPTQIRRKHRQSTYHESRYEYVRDRFQSNQGLSESSKDNERLITLNSKYHGSKTTNLWMIPETSIKSYPGRRRSVKNDLSPRQPKRKTSLIFNEVSDNDDPDVDDPSSEEKFTVQYNEKPMTIDSILSSPY